MGTHNKHIPFPSTLTSDHINKTMSRRSGRKTKAPDVYNPSLPIPIRNSSSAQTTSKPTQHGSKRGRLTPANALQTTSPILQQDLQSLFASTVSTWSTLPEAKKRILIDAFPPAYRIYESDDTADAGLKCPISEHFVTNDHIIKRDVARFKRNVEEGLYLKKWQEEGKRAMKARVEGEFEEYLQWLAEEDFGRVEGGKGEGRKRERDGDGDGDDGDGKARKR